MSSWYNNQININLQILEYYTESTRRRKSSVQLMVANIIQKTQLEKGKPLICKFKSNSNLYLLSQFSLSRTKKNQNRNEKCTEQLKSPRDKYHSLTRLSSWILEARIPFLSSSFSNPIAFNPSRPGSTNTSNSNSFQEYKSLSRLIPFLIYDKQ